MNDLAEIINELGCGVKFNEETISILLYADDIALITPDEQSLQLMLNKLTDWCSKWKLSVNPEKTKVIHFRPQSFSLTDFLSTKIYDKRDDFNFKIISFPNMCSNIPASPAYGVYISQLIRYAKASSNYSDFLKRHLYLRNRLLDQGYKQIRLIRSLKKFIFRYHDLVEIYSVSAETIINDGFSYSENV